MRLYFLSSSMENVRPNGNFTASKALNTERMPTKASFPKFKLPVTTTEPARQSMDIIDLPPIQFKLSEIPKCQVYSQAPYVVSLKLTGESYVAYMIIA